MRRLASNRPVNDEPGEGRGAGADGELAPAEGGESPGPPVLEVIRRISEPGDVLPSKQVAESEERLMGHTEQGIRPGDPAELPERPNRLRQMLQDLEAHHEVEALVPEGQRACVPSHERGAGAARARLLQRRFIEFESIELRPRQPGGQGGQDDALAAADFEYAARALDGCYFRHPTQEAPDQVADYWVLGPVLPLVVAPRGSGDQSSRRRIETSSVRVW